MTPDLPLVFFWTLYLTWTSRIHSRLESWNCDPVTRVYHNSPISPMDWLLGGVVLGLGLLSSYSMGLAIACSTATFFSRTKLRAWWMGFSLHLLVALILALPLIVFNYHHEFQPFLFQWRQWSIDCYFYFSRFFQFWSLQALCVGFVPLIFIPRIFLLWRYLWDDPKLQPCVVFFLIPATYFLYKSLTCQLEAHWVLVLYLSAWPLIERVCQISSFKSWNRMLLVFGFLPAWVASGALFVHMFYPLSSIQPYKDRFRVALARTEVTSLVAKELKDQPIRSAFFAPNWEWTSIFRFEEIATEQLPTGRTTQYTLNPVDPCQFQTIYYWMPEGAERPDTLSCFSKQNTLKNYLVMARGVKVESYQLVRFEK